MGIETKTLRNKITEWTNLSTKLEDVISEDIKDEFLLAVGQAELIIKGKFKQFSGLIDQCEANDGLQKTTCQDLQGFWEMMYAQVDNINMKFDRLSKLQANNWKETEVKTIVQANKKLLPKLVHRPIPHKAKVGSSSMRALIQAKRAAKRNNDRKETLQQRI